MSPIDIRIIPTLFDNYVFVIHDPEANVTVCIDPGDDPIIADTVKKWGWAITHILVTHPHYDHVDGIADLVDEFNCEVYGSHHDYGVIPRCDFRLQEDEVVTLGSLKFKVIDVPGHMRHHIAYYLKSEDALFSGDTLFSMGCGRLLGGTAAQLYQSLKTLSQLPEQTKIYCTHEYTQANAKFALSVDPHNEALKARARDVDQMRQDGEFTIPVLLGLELKTNPFLRCDSEQEFAALRRQKDNF
ncbi:MAG: hydroxyacylglutathione hydrolase [Rhodospirillaceae bacterium]|nr:MAG: hydroxyacylglutathione hydrolase [Rhodospirillaceae bacterium]